MGKPRKYVFMMKGNDMEELKVFTATEAAKLLGVMPRTIWTYIKDGKLKARKVGRAWKITDESLKGFLNGTPEGSAAIKEIREVQSATNETRLNLKDGIFTIYYADAQGLEQGREQAKSWLK